MKKKTITQVLFIFILTICLFAKKLELDKELMIIESLKDPSLAPIDYILGPGDRLEIHLWGNANAVYRLRISQDGMIFIPRYSGITQIPSLVGAAQSVSSLPIAPLGEVMAEGLVVAELREAIEKRVKKYYRGVHVRVSLAGLRSFTVSVLGSVEFPGVYSITPLYRITNLIDISGGILATGSYRNVIVEHSCGVTDTFDLYKFLYKGESEQNPYIRAGDMVFVPQALMSVKITGKVFRTGNYELKEEEKLKDFIEMAGGFQKGASLTRNIKVFNIKDPDKVLEIDPYKLLVEDDSLSNIKLQAGDVVTIPVEPYTITVVGQVTLGGTFQYEPGADYNFYLGLAGGYGERANEGDVRITRWDGTRLKWKKGVEIKPGDTIVVGRSELKGWRDYLEVTLNAANLIFIIWTVSTYNK